MINQTIIDTKEQKSYFGGNLLLYTRILVLIFLFFQIISAIYAQTQSVFTPEVEVTSEVEKVTTSEAGIEGDFYLLKSTEVISTEELRQRNANHVTELLQDIPGVSVVGGNTPQFRRVTVRGLDGFRVVQQVDGARRYEETQFALSSDIGVEAEFLKAVTVSKGAESLTVASGAIGGVVSYETLNPSDMLQGNQTSATRVKGSYSSASQSYGQTIATATKVGKDTGLLLQLGRRTINRNQSGGDVGAQSSEMDYERNSYMAKIENKNSFGTTRIKGSFSETKSLDTTYRQGYDDATTDYNDSTVEGTIDHRYISPSNPLININANAYINKRESEKVTDTPWLGFESTVGTTLDEFDQMSGKISNKFVFALSDAHMLETEVGGSYSQLETNEKDGTDISYYGKSRGNDQGVFVMNNLNLYNDKIIISGGARANRYERESDILAVDVKDSRGSTFSNVIGLTVKPLPYVDLFAKVTNSNRAPEVRELYSGGGQPFACHFPRKICNNMPNSELNEEDAFGREVGFSLHSKNNSALKTKFTGSYFYEEIGDYIEAMPRMYRIVDGQQVMAGPNDATHRTYSNMNLNEVIRQGIEATASVSYKDIDFSVKYSAMNMDCKLCPEMYSATTIDEPLYTAPADAMVTKLNYDLSRFNLNIGYRGQFVRSQKRLSQRYLNANYGTPGYSTHSVFVGWEPTYQWTGRFRVDAALNNLTNKRFRVHNSGTNALELGQDLRVSLTKFF